MHSEVQVPPAECSCARWSTVAAFVCAAALIFLASALLELDATRELVGRVDMAAPTRCWSLDPGRQVAVDAGRAPGAWSVVRSLGDVTIETGGWIAPCPTQDLVVDEETGWFYCAPGDSGIEVVVGRARCAAGIRPTRGWSSIYCIPLNFSRASADALPVGPEW